MNITMILKALANGVNPETGELLPRSSAAYVPDLIRQLFALSEEFSIGTDSHHPLFPCEAVAPEWGCILLWKA